MVYKATVTSYVTIFEERTFFVNADSAEEAVNKANDEFDIEIGISYDWADYDETNVQLEMECE